MLSIDLFIFETKFSNFFYFASTIFSSLAIDYVLILSNFYSLFNNLILDFLKKI